MVTVALARSRRSTAWARAWSCPGRLRERHDVLETAFGGQAQWRASRVRGHCGGRSSTRSSSTAFPRPRARVQAMQGAVVRLLAVSVRAEVTQGRGASSCSGRPGSAPGALWRGMDVFWAPLGARVLTSLVPGFVGAVAGQHQGSERERFDTVWHVGNDQGRRWHEVACHATAWHGLGCLIQTMSSASGEVDVVR
jgi:hypothetical protein